MTKPSVSIRELLDESLVEQLTGELAAPPKQGVLLHRIALAAACLLLVAGIAGVGLWASRQSPAILGPTSAVSEEASSPSSSDDWQRMLAAMLPPTQAALPETGDTLPVAERPLLTMEEMRGRLQDFCREQGLIILEETTSPVCVSMGEDLRYILARVADNPLAISQLSVTPSGSISVGVSQPVLGSVGGFSRPILPPEGTDMAAPGALTKLARSYYERFRALCPMDEVAVEAWTEGYLSYPEGAADPVVSPVYHVTVYPKTAAPLQALGAAGLLLLGGGRAQGRHLCEEVVEGIVQHPVHPAEQAGHGREEIIEEAVAEQAVSEEVLHHPAAGVDPLGVAQLLRAVAAQVLFLHMAVHIAAIHKGNLILTTIFTFHKSIPPIQWNVCPAGVSRCVLSDSAPFGGA